MQNYLSGKSIVFFTPETYPSYAGAGLNARAFAFYLSEYTNETTLCCLNYNKDLPVTEMMGKLRIERIPYYNKRLIYKMLSLPYLLINYYRWIRRADFIFVYSGYLIGYQFIIYLASIYKRKIIFRSTLIGGDDPDSLLAKGFFQRKLNRFILKRLTLYYSINPVFTIQLQSIFGNYIRVIETFQGVNSTRFHPSAKEHKKYIREKLQLEPGELIILSVGILLKKKGFHLVFPELNKLDIPFRYIIAGNYSPVPHHNLSAREKAEMEEVYQLGIDILGEKLTFTGSVEKIEDYYYAADIFLLPSLQEGTPNVLLEAMACGLPCISTKLKGISGILTLNEVNSIEYSSVGTLAESIQHLTENPTYKESIGKHAAQTIADNYTFEKVADKIFSSINA